MVILCWMKNKHPKANDGRQQHTTNNVNFKKGKLNWPTTVYFISSLKHCKINNNYQKLIHISKFRVRSSAPGDFFVNHLPINQLTMAKVTSFVFLSHLDSERMGKWRQEVA